MSFCIDCHHDPNKFSECPVNGQAGYGRCAFFDSVLSPAGADPAAPCEFVHKDGSVCGADPADCMHDMYMRELGVMTAEHDYVAGADPAAGQAVRAAISRAAGQYISRPTSPRVRFALDEAFRAGADVGAAEASRDLAARVLRVLRRQVDAISHGGKCPACGAVPYDLVYFDRHDSRCATAATVALIHDLESLTGEPLEAGGRDE
jgi:hypothetical protein